jgi:hypothetical protein
MRGLNQLRIVVLGIIHAVANRVRNPALRSRRRDDVRNVVVLRI